MDFLNFRDNRIRNPIGEGKNEDVFWLGKYLDSLNASSISLRNRNLSIWAGLIGFTVNNFWARLTEGLWPIIGIYIIKLYKWNFFFFFVKESKLVDYCNFYLLLSFSFFFKFFIFFFYWLGTPFSWVEETFSLNRNAS